MRLVDTHCHLNLAEAFPDPATTLEEARNAGVDRVIVIGIDPETSMRAVELAEQFDGVYATVGWHPNDAAKFDQAGLAQIAALLDDPKVVALGEVGLDLHWNFATLDQQRQALHPQLDLALDRGKPVVLHCRKAYPELLELLESRAVPPLVFHCFSGDADDLRRGLVLDAMFGFDGPVTYRNAAGLRSLLRSVPRERVILETDSPYLPPEPHRGKPNRPAWLTHINGAVADALGLSAETCAAITTANAERFFRLGPPSGGE